MTPITTKNPSLNKHEKEMTVEELICKVDKRLRFGMNSTRIILGRSPAFQELYNRVHDGHRVSILSLIGLHLEQQFTDDAHKKISSVEHGIFTGWVMVIWDLILEKDRDNPIYNRIKEKESFSVAAERISVRELADFCKSYK